MSRSEAPLVTFVLVNWNTRELLLLAADRLRSFCAAENGELIVVDNGSGDGSAEATAERFPHAVLIRNEKNRGFAAAANQGIRRGRGSIFCLLNPDVEVEAAPLRLCLEAIEADPAIGALGPLLLDAAGEDWEYSDRFPTAAGEAARAILQARSQGKLSRARALGGDLHGVDWLAGACLFLRRDALERTGLLDERFFLYKEDVDLCRRLHANGYRVVRHHGARIKHGIAQSVRRNPGEGADRARIEGMRSSVLYARKHEGRGPARGLAFALRLALLPRIAKASFLARLGRPADRSKSIWMREAFAQLDRDRERPGAGSDARPEAGHDAGPGAAGGGYR